jgi:hypothetical protein
VTPTLRRPNLNPNNIFVTEYYKISGLIDRQHTVVLPLFLQAQIPEYFQDFGDKVSRITKQPTLPENFDELSEGDQTAALEQYRCRKVHLFYKAGTSKYNRVHFSACNRSAGLFAPRIFQHATTPYEGDSITFKVDLVHALLNWDRVAGGSSDECPISIANEEAQESLPFAELTEQADEYDRILRNQMGISADGWVPVSEYEMAVKKHASLKEKILRGADTEEEK